MAAPGLAQPLVMQAVLTPLQTREQRLRAWQRRHRERCQRQVQVPECWMAVQLQPGSQSDRRQTTPEEQAEPLVGRNADPREPGGRVQQRPREYQQRHGFRE